MRNKKITLLIFALALILQLAVLFSMVVSHELRIRFGRHIVVKTVPIDPRSLFRGDYVRLNYEFSRIDLGKISSPKKHFYPGDKISVKLVMAGDDWVTAAISDKPLKQINPNEIILTGTVRQESSLAGGRYINVVYGIESYFVPEGKGKHIEREIFQKKVKAELSLDGQGNAAVCKLFLGDKEIKFY